MLYFGLLLILSLALFSRNLHIIDLFLIICLYYDASIVFSGTARTLFGYSQILVSVAYFSYYLLNKARQLDTYTRTMVLIVLALFLAMLVLPVLKGVGFDPALRSALYNFASYCMLPIAFHHYSTRGDIRTLLKIGAIFIVSWVLLVLMFSIARIDTSRAFNAGTEGFGLGIIYFGDMSARGAISYIALLLLIVPIMLKKDVVGNRTILIIASTAMLSIILIALKRFSLLALAIGIANYVINTKISFKQKLSVTAGIIGILVLLIFFSNIGALISQSYFRRGAEAKFSTTVMEDDVRIYEPFYILQESWESGLAGLLFGSQTERTFDIDSAQHRIIGRKIHNDYGQFLLMYGLIGLLSYVLLFSYQYSITRRFSKQIRMMGILDQDYWITYQNVLLVFVIGGMVGGHVHITYRAIALVFSAALSGHLYKILRSNPSLKNLQNTAKEATT